MNADSVNHPAHYTDVVPGVECIEVTEHFSFCRGNAIKYLWRAGAKGNLRQDLEKAKWYIDRELAGLDRVDHRNECSGCGAGPGSRHSDACDVYLHRLRTGAS